MRYMYKLFFAALLLFSNYAQAQQKITNKDLNEIRDRLVGNFDNSEQASNDRNYSANNLHFIAFTPGSARKSNNFLKMKGKKKDVTPEPKLADDMKGGFWLYVEESRMAKSSVATGQNFLHFTRLDDQTVLVKSYDAPNPGSYAGSWSDPSKMKNLKLEDLSEQQHCEVYLKKDESGNYYGTTAGRECTSTTNGASYATVDVMIYPNMFLIWERGFDANGNQVWGATRESYKYTKYGLPR
jgi:hypothetical protein